ncbi:MAG: hypothetical protein OXU73_00185 [Candidatus Campbellbacteria bacterium]|nr:hypothetical protein [Candidatus Campbellbacteria bacterium]
MEYLKKKYFVSALVGGITILFVMWLVEILFLHLFGFTYQVVDISSFTSVLAVFLIAYAIGYIHERIPHCPTPFLWKILRFGGMMFVLIAPLLFVFYGPYDAYAHLYWIEMSLDISFIGSAVIVYTMYQFEPGRSVHYGTKKN